MKTNFAVEEIKVGDIRIENVKTETIYTPQELIETVKSLTEMLGKDVISTIMKTAVLGNMR